MFRLDQAGTRFDLAAALPLHFSVSLFMFLIHQHLFVALLLALYLIYPFMVLAAAQRLKREEPMCPEGVLFCFVLFYLLECDKQPCLMLTV